MRRLLLTVSFVVLSGWTSLMWAAGGWYLMTPPLKDSPGSNVGIVDFEAPFRHWRTEGSYDAANDCRDAKARLMRQAQQTLTGTITLEGPPDYTEATKRNAREWVAIANAAVCVSTDDPRLGQ